MREDVFNLGIKGVIRNEAGEILLLQAKRVKPDGTEHTYWDLPGGRIERGSTVEDTLRRELAEEIGVTGVTDIAPLGMILTDVRIPVGDGETVGLILGVYRCSLPADAEIRLSDEHSDFGWFAAERAVELLGVKYPGEFFGVAKKLAV